MDRIAALNEVLSQDPNNAFARYGLAMEFANSGQIEQALAEPANCFRPILTMPPDISWRLKRWSNLTVPMRRR